MKTARTSQLPLFSTQILGSFPRPRVVRDLLARREEWSAERFRQIMDDFVRFCIRLQGMAGLDVVSDGQWRSIQETGEFFRRVGGFERVRKITHGSETKLKEVVTGRMNPVGSVFRADASFLVNNTARLTKFILPSPYQLARRYWVAEYSKGAYATQAAFMDHLTELLAAEVHTLVAEGIDIIQVDDMELPRLSVGGTAPLGKGCVKGESSRDWDLDRQAPVAVAVFNKLVDAARGKAEVHLHPCHGVCQCGEEASGSYAPLLARFKGLRVDRVNLEFSCRGAGRLEDLSALPGEMGVGLGLVDGRPGAKQSEGALEEMARAAARVIDPERIALNTGCGFIHFKGESADIDEGYEKLRQLTLLAQRVRGKG